jgi:hypothetical protein
MSHSPRPEIIDGKAVKSLVEAKAVSGATILGQPGGWAVVIRYGAMERAVAAQRSQRMRLWRNLNTAANFVREELGVGRFEVETAEHDPSVNEIKRPDQSERLRRQQEAVEHDAWFRAQVEQSLKEADDPSAVWVPHEEASARWNLRRAALLKKIADQEAAS